MRVVMLAPPGAGKGTQAERISEHYGVRHLSTGEMLRREMSAGTPLGEKVEAYVNRGDLVPDELLVDVLREALVDAAAHGGYILDGFPRTMDQAHAAYDIAKEHGILVQAVLHLVVDEEELVRRMHQRAVEGGRADDTEDVIRHRIEVYSDKTKPLLEWYRGRGVLIDIDGERPVEEVAKVITAQLDAAAVARPDGG